VRHAVRNSLLGVEQRVDELPRYERREVADRLAEADELHGDAELGFDGEHDAALGRAIQLGEHHAGHLRGVGELARLHEAVLPGGRVDHQQHFGDRADCRGGTLLCSGEIVVLCGGCQSLNFGYLSSRSEVSVCFADNIENQERICGASIRMLRSDHQTKNSGVRELTMGIFRLNHAVLYVRDVGVTKRFYSEVLGFEAMIEDPAGRYLFMRAAGSKNHHDIAFFAIGKNAKPSEAGQRTVGMYHIAWEVATLEELEAMRERLAAANALVGASDHGVNKSLYCRDPDGLEFEVMWLVPQEHWGSMAHEAIIEPLDLAADRRHFAQFGLS